jgi:hypothetical protein
MRPESRELRDQPPSHGRREKRVTGGYDPDSVEECLRSNVLEEKAARARLECVVDVFVEVEGREDENVGPGVAGRLDDSSRRLNAVLHRHANVHQHDVRAMLHRKHDSLCAICRGSDDLEVGLCAEKCGEPRPHHLLVVDDECCDHGLIPSGSVASTTKPPPSAAPQVNVPPARVARSRIPIRPWPGSGSPVASPAP